MIGAPSTLRPYVGLRSFEPQESLLFHGRKQHTQQLLRVLSAHRFVGVVGTSGSGKSSLVKAGLLPALYRGYLRGATSRWKTALMRPGPTPMLRLAEALCREETGLGISEPPEQVAKKLSEHSAAFTDLLRERLEREKENLLLVVDQFEEIFQSHKSSNADAAREAAFFVALLLRSVEELEVPVYVVLTMRSEYLGESARYQGLSEVLSEAQYLIPRLTREQLEEAIRGPLDMVGATIEDALVQQLLNDAGNDPDQLPALQHALMRLDAKRGPDQALTLDLYRRHADTVRLGRSLNHHAEEILASLTEQQRDVWAERVFRCLTTVEDGLAIRRPGKLAHLYEVCGAETEVDRERVRSIVSAYAAMENALLFDSTAGILDDNSWIDITHESLIRQWERLQGWLRLEAENAEWLGRLVQFAQLKEENKAELWGKSEVIYTARLRDEQKWNAKWAKQYCDGIAYGQAMRFLSDSQEALEQKEKDALQRAAELEDARQKQLEAAEQAASAKERELLASKRGRTRLLWLIAGLLAVTVGLIFVAGKWREERQHVDELRQAGAGSQLETIAELRNEIAGLHKSETGSVRVNPKDGLRYVSIPAGEFQMGCSTGDSECFGNEKPPHPVKITKSFWIGQTEVTQAAYEKLMGKNPSNFKGADRPVENVAWDEAKAYCNAAGMRLPTEAEWEYAARAGNKESRYGKLDDIAWYSGNSGSSTKPVATKLPNAYGLYDMLGNVWEWTNDWYEESYYRTSPKEDPPGSTKGEGKILRGGSWLFIPLFVRVSERLGYHPAYRFYSYGFRCAGELR